MTLSMAIWKPDHRHGESMAKKVKKPFGFSEIEPDNDLGQESLTERPRGELRGGSSGKLVLSYPKLLKK